MDKEEKAKAYDKVREKIAYRFGSNVAEEIFSEFEESEDEKIRKGLLNFLQSPFVNKNIADEKVAPWIAWLEKQKDTNVLVQEASEKAYTEGMRVERKHWFEKQDEQKPILDFKASNWYVSKVDGKIHDLTYNPTDNVKPKFNVGDKLISTKNPHLTYEIIDIEDNELGELDYKVIIYTDGKDGVTHNISCKNVDAWGELVKEKPAWSEEDDKQLDIAIESCQFLNKIETTDWLKSLKERLIGLRNTTMRT